MLDQKDLQKVGKHWLTHVYKIKHIVRKKKIKRLNQTPSFY